MGSLQTLVNGKKLEKWCKNLPECEIFLTNFFLSCEPYTLDTNSFNYHHDIQTQMKIDPNWKRYENQLMEAFDEITKYWN